MQTGPREGRPADTLHAPLLAAGVVVALATVVPLVVAAHYHALGIPRSDDWSYLVTEFRWLDGGGLSFNRWVSMSLVGQLLAAAPVAWLLPHDITALQVTTAATGSVGLLAVLGTARRVGLGLAPATLLAASVAVGPLWAPLAVSFMTDVPAFAASTAAMYFAVHHLTGDRTTAWDLWIAVALGFVAFTIRQYGIVTLVAVLVVGFFVAPDDGRRRTVAFVGASAALAVAVFLLWWRTVPDVRALTPTAPDGHALRVLVSKGAGFLRLVGLSLLPVLAIVHPWARVRAAVRRAPATTIVVAIVVAAWLALTAGRVRADLFVGNYLVHDGVLSDIVMIGRRADVLPGAAWALIAAVASAAGVVLGVLAVDALVAAGLAYRDGRRRPDPVTLFLVLVVAGYALTYALAMLSGLQVYDRYVLPLLPAAGLLLLRARVVTVAEPGPTQPPAVRVGIAGVVALGVLALLGLSFATDSASFDGARWRVAERAVEHGWSARTVNGGFEWRNFHRGVKLPEGRKRRERICVTVHVDPNVSPERVVAVVRSTAPTRRSMRLVAYRTRTPCAPR